MRWLFQFWPRLAFVAGTTFTAYGGYGAGIGHALGAHTMHWLQVAVALLGGVLCMGIGLWRGGRRTSEPPASFATDLAALERLVPKVRRHPEGLTILQDLIEILFESCHRSESLPNRETSVVRATTGGQNNG